MSIFIEKILIRLTLQQLAARNVAVQMSYTMAAIGDVKQRSLSGGCYAKTAELGAGIEAYLTGSEGYLKTCEQLPELPCCEQTLWNWVHHLAGMAQTLYRQAVTVLAEFKTNWKFENDDRLFATKFPLAVLTEKHGQLTCLYQLFILRDYFTSIIEPGYFLVYRLLAGQMGLTPEYRIEDLSCQVKDTLVNLYTKQKLKPILIIDEAQNLSDTILEEIRLLTNYRMDSQHYLSVFLLAHPVLKAQLKLPPYAALKQRLSFFYHLTGFEQDEVSIYLMHRLKLAGCSNSIFSPEAIALIFNYAKGLPRIIDTLAHEALFKATYNNSLSVDESLIELIIHEWEDL